MRLRCSYLCRSFVLSLFLFFRFVSLLLLLWQCEHLTAITGTNLKPVLVCCVFFFFVCTFCSCFLCNLTSMPIMPRFCNLKCRLMHTLRTRRVLYATHVSRQYLHCAHYFFYEYIIAVLHNIFVFSSL